MSAEEDKVTFSVVDQLWAQTINGEVPATDMHEHVEALMSLVSAESPVVNWGMLDLYDLTRDPDLAVEALVDGRASWLAKVAEYDVDPEAWMRRYFVGMVVSFAGRHGRERGREFAEKLVRDGQLQGEDLPPELQK